MKPKEKTSNFFKAYKIIWQVMNFKEKISAILITLACVFKCFANILITQVLACVVSKLEGKSGIVLGFSLPKSWTVIEVVIFCYSLVALSLIVGFIISNILKKFAIKMSCKVNSLVLDYLTTPRKNFDFKMTNGEAVFIAKSAGDSVVSLLKDFWCYVFIPVVSCIIALFYIAQIDILCFVIFLASFGLIIATCLIRIKIQAKIDNKLEKSKSKINSLYLNDIVNLPLITLLKTRKHEKELLEKENNNYKTQFYKVTDLALGYWIIAYILEYFFVALGVIVCILKTGANPVNIENVVLLISYSAQLCSPLEMVGLQLGNLQQRAIQLIRLNLLKVKPNDLLLDKVGKDEHSNKYYKLPDDVVINNIKMKNIKVNIGDFKRAYPNIEFKNNCINVVTGDSGSGKSVIVGSLIGIKSYESGTILINDKYEIKSLYGNTDKVSYVMQNAMIFDRSVAENIAYPNNALPKDCEKYLKTFGLNEIIKREQVDANVISTLSGGEQRRIAFVRGMSKKAPIYIFDEPTNDLDNLNIEKFLKEVSNLKKHSMVIIISHDKRVFEITDNLIEL